MDGLVHAADMHILMNECKHLGTQILYLGPWMLAQLLKLPPCLMLACNSQVQICGSEAASLGFKLW